MMYLFIDLYLALKTYDMWCDDTNFKIQRNSSIFNARVLVLIFKRRLKNFFVLGVGHKSLYAPHCSVSI